jgi:hypothetical protein
MTDEVQPLKRKRGRPPKNGEGQPKSAVPTIVKPTPKQEVLGPSKGDPKAKFTDSFLKDFREAWAVGGAKALRAMAERDPSGFVKTAALLMPKDVLVDARGAGIVVVKLGADDMAL